MPGFFTVVSALSNNFAIDDYFSSIRHFDFSFSFSFFFLGSLSIVVFYKIRIFNQNYSSKFIVWFLAIK